MPASLPVEVAVNAIIALVGVERGVQAASTNTNNMAAKVSLLII
jgi:hypothetical protein